jgi:catechol 2,3-dioxygenase-like lactoylglutathione lyase family enzyme
MATTSAHITGALQAVTVVTNCWAQSIRFYTEGLGYQILQQGHLTLRQREIFGYHLDKFALLGYEAEGSVVRLIETHNAAAIPNRIGAKPWDNGLCVIEAGTSDVENAYFKVLRARFGAIAPPTEFDCEGPEPLGYVLMRSTAFIGPSGEQLFVTQIVGRKGGVSLLKEKTIDGINAPANAVISLATRQQQQQYEDVLGLVPVNDLPLKQPGAASIMGGPTDMGFEMCLMGHGMERIGMEQHVYSPQNPDYEYKTYPCDFSMTGIASACWQGKDLEILRPKLIKNNWPILSDIGLPVKGNPEPLALVFRGPVGEIIELLASS